MLRPGFLRRLEYFNTHKNSNVYLLDKCKYSADTVYRDRSVLHLSCSLDECSILPAVNPSTHYAALVFSQLSKS